MLQQDRVQLLMSKRKKRRLPAQLRQKRQLLMSKRRMMRPPAQFGQKGSPPRPRPEDKLQVLPPSPHLGQRNLRGLKICPPWQVQESPAAVGCMVQMSIPLECPAVPYKLLSKWVVMLEL